MSWQPRRGVLRVLGPATTTGGTGTAGTAFLVRAGAEPLVVTAAHVVRLAQPGPAGTVHLTADPDDSGQPTGLTAQVLQEHWTDPQAEDVAVLRLLDEPPAGCAPLPVGVLLDEGGEHRSFGFPRAKAVEGLGATVREFARTTDAGFPALSARSENVSHGYSGGPVWDDATDHVVGMVMSIVGAQADAGGRQTTAFFLRGSELLWQVCPALRGGSDNPYRGLEVFEAEHAALYFGRDRAVAGLLQRLTDHDLVTVVGPSGSGKSSLARAGLEKGLASTEVLGLSDLPRTAFRPGPVPQVDLALAAAAVATAPRVEQALGLPAGALSATSTDAAERLLLPDPGALAAGLRTALEDGALLVVDQFERIYTECKDESARTRFVRTLLALASSDVKLVLTLRADFYGHVLRAPELASAVEAGQVTVLPMTRDELLAAVVEPARAQQRGLEPGLAELLVADVEGHPGDLPLLQLVLTELWQRDAPSGVLRTSTYRELGARSADGEDLRVRGVIARLAEHLWKGLDDDEQRAGVRVLLTLVADPVGASGPTAGTTSRRALVREWDGPTRAVADRLVAARLLTTGSDVRTGEPTVELAHESLLWAWPRLRRLVRQHADFVRWYDTDLAPWLRHWDGDGTSSDRLLRGGLLTAAERWADTAPELLSEPALAFVAASLAEREADRERRTRAAERERERDRAVRLSEALRLASEARQAASAEPETAFLVAWEALLRDRNELTESVFRETLGGLPAPVVLVRHALGGPVVAGFLGPHTVFVVGARDGQVLVTDLDGQVLGRSTVPGSGPVGAAVLPGADRLVVHRDGRTVLLTPAGDVVATLALPAGAITSTRDVDVDVAADGRRVLVRAGGRGALLEAGRDELSLLAELTFTTDSFDPFEVDDVLHRPLDAPVRARFDRAGAHLVTEGLGGLHRWSPDGTPLDLLRVSQPISSAELADGSIVVGGMDGSGCLLAPDGVRLRELDVDSGGRDLYVRDVDGTGTHFLTASGVLPDVHVHDASGDVLRTFADHGDYPWCARFSPSGRLVASGGGDRTVRVGDWASAEPRTVLSGHRRTVTTVAFSPTDESVLLSADQDGEVRLWRLGSSVVPVLDSGQGTVRTLLRTRRGGVLAAGEATTSLWRGTRRVRLPGAVVASDRHDDEVGTVITRDAQQLRVWDVGSSSPAELGTVPHGGSPGLWDRVAVAGDGRRVAVVRGPQVSLWSPSGSRIAVLDGPDDPHVEEPHERVVGLAFRPGGDRLAVGSRNGMLWLWSADGELLGSALTDLASPDRLFTVAVDPRGELVATGVRGTVGLWDWSGHEVAALRTSGYKNTSVAFSPDGELLVAVADNPGGHTSTSVQLWRRSGEGVAVLDMSADAYGAPLFDPGGRYACLRSGRGLAVLSAAGERVARLAGPHGTSLMTTALSPDGDLIAAALSDGVVRVWSWTERRRVQTLAVGDITALAFTADGTSLLAAGPAGEVLAHPMDVDDLFPAAARRTGRVLSTDELERFGLAGALLDADALAAWTAGAPQQRSPRWSPEPAH